MGWRSNLVLNVLCYGIVLVFFRIHPSVALKVRTCGMQASVRGEGRATVGPRRQYLAGGRGMGGEVSRCGDVGVTEEDLPQQPVGFSGWVSVAVL